MIWPFTSKMDAVEFIRRVARYATRIGALATFVTSMNLVLERNFMRHCSPACLERNASLAQDSPPFARFFWAHKLVFMIFFFSLSAAALAAGLGLQRRKEWARVLVMVVQATLLVWMVGVSIVGFLPITESGGALRFGADRIGQFGGPNPTPVVAYVLITLVMAAIIVVFARTIRRLASAEVRALFQGPAQ